MAEEKFVRVNIKENVKQDIDVLASIEHRNAYEVMADAIKLYKAIAYGKTDKRLKKIVESLPETKLTIVG